MRPIAAVSIALSLGVILAYLAFSQNKHDFKIFKDTYTFSDTNATDHGSFEFATCFKLDPQFPLRILSVESLYLHN